MQHQARSECLNRFMRHIACANIAGDSKGLYKIIHAVDSHDFNGQQLCISNDIQQLKENTIARLLTTPLPSSSLDVLQALRQLQAATAYRCGKKGHLQGKVLTTLTCSQL